MHSYLWHKYLYYYVIGLCSLSLFTHGFSVDQFAGIWQIQSECLPYEQDIRSKLFGLWEGKKRQQEILIKLNKDGTFHQCNEGTVEGKSISGCWEISEEKIVLAVRRQYYGPRFDVLLEGGIDMDTEKGSLPVILGQVKKGKFIHPRNHPSFFENNLVNEESLGPFTLVQSISSSSLSPNYNTSSEEDFLDLQSVFE